MKMKDDDRESIAEGDYRYYQPKWETEKMESWRLVWRNGFAQLLSTESLKALLRALEEDDPALMQGATTSPPPMACVQNWPVEAACVIGYCGWKEGLETVGEVDEFFAKTCFGCDSYLGEPAGCRWFLNWVDETPRAEMRRQLGWEVRRELDRRFQEGAHVRIAD